MKKLLLLFIVLMTLGCGQIVPPSKKITNDQIIQETKKCKDAGLSTRQFVNGYGVIVSIQCSNEIKEK